MPHNTVAVVGAAETTKLGVIPDMSQIQLHADAALNAMADGGLKPKDIDGVATAGETPVQIAHYLGITPNWVDGTVGRRLLVHDPCPPRRRGDRGGAGEDHPDHAWRERPLARRPPAALGAAASLNGQFEQPYGPMGPPSMFTIPVLRYMKTYGVTHEQIAMVAVVQREWAAKNPRATFRDPITVEDVLNSRMIAYPFRLLHVLPGDRWRRRADPDLRRPRQGFPDKAGLHPRHRRERRDADGQPDGGLHLARARSASPARRRSARPASRTRTSIT